VKGVQKWRAEGTDLKSSTSLINSSPYTSLRMHLISTSSLPCPLLIFNDYTNSTFHSTQIVRNTDKTWKLRSVSKKQRKKRRRKKKLSPENAFLFFPFFLVYSVPST
jgi:hypothetical protein